MKITKKILFCFLTILILLFSSSALAEEKDVNLVINGKVVNFEQKPILKNSRVLVPFRAIFEEFGFLVNWDNETETATGINDEYEVSFTINNNISKVYDKHNNVTKDYNLDVTAQMIEDRTYIPLRALSESIGADVNWDDGTYTVTINTKNDDVQEAINYDEFMASLDDKIGAGGDFFAVVDEHGNLYFWGNNEKVNAVPGGAKIINVPQVIMRNVSKIKCGKSFIMALDTNGELFIIGDTLVDSLDENSSGTTLFKNIVDIAAGDNHILALDSEGHLYVWGDNKNGQLGLIDVEYVDKPTLIADNVVQIEAEDCYSIVKLKENNCIFLVIL